MASLSSTGSVSSSNSLGNTSLRGFGGMVSGIDRDSIIEQMTLGTTTKINNVKTDITKLQWKQEAYRSLSDQILDITDKYTSFSSSTSLLDPMTFARSIITVEGSDKSSKYVKATGTSDMIDTIALEGVEKLASSAVQQSGMKQSESGLVTGLDDLDKDISVSRLNNGGSGRTLTFGIYSAVNGWSNTVSFTFPTQYQERDENGVLKYDENGNKIMKDIDYTSENYKEVAKQLNYALQDSSASINVNGKSTKLSECFEFKYVEEETKDKDGNKVKVGKMMISTDGGKKGLGNYKINSSASSALSALGYSGTGGAIDMKKYNESLGSFADSSVTRMSVLDALTGAKVNFTYNGSTKEIEMITTTDKAVIDGITLGTGEDSILARADDVIDILAKGFGLTNIDTLKSEIAGIRDDGSLSKEEKESRITSKIQDALWESESIKDAITKSTEDQIASNAGISRDKIGENYIKETLTGLTVSSDGQAAVDTRYKELLDAEIGTIKGTKTQEELAKELGIDKDKVISASGLNIDDLAEIHGVKRDDAVEVYRQKFKTENPNVDVTTAAGKKQLETYLDLHIEDIKKEYENIVLEKEYGQTTAEENKKAYDADVETAYQAAIDEAVTARANDNLTAKARDEIAKVNGIERDGEKLGVERPDGMSDEDYDKAVDEAYTKAVDEAVEQEVSDRYQKAVTDAVNKANGDGSYATIEAEKKTAILTDTFDTALHDASNNSLQQKKLEKMVELLQPRLNKAFGEGKDGPNVEAVVLEGKLAFKAASSNTSLSITTGSSGSSVLGNMGIISGATNKVNLNGDLKQESLKLSEEALKNLEEGGDGLVINGTKINGITKDSTISDILNKINKSDAGVKATYVQSSGQFMLVSEETGAGRQIKLDSALARELFGQTDATGAYEVGKGFKEGEDAIVHVNYGNGMSVVVQNSSNTFNLEGLTVTVTGEFGGTKGADGVWKADSSERVTFSAKADTDAVTEKVKSFFEDFNKLVTETYSQLTTRSDSSYGPLTDEQKAEMSETSIENWEKKAKEGILYNDSIIRDLNSTLEGFLTQVMGSGINYQDLEKIGITYDESWSGGASTIVFNETKFRSAMENDPDLVSDIFTGAGKSGGVGLVKTVEDMLTPYATRVASKNRGSGSDRGSYGRLIEEAGSEKVPTSTLNNFIYQQIKEMNEKIQTLQSQLKSQQERYIKQFTSMETLINQYNSQSGYLSNLTG